MKLKLILMTILFLVSFNVSASAKTTQSDIAYFKEISLGSEFGNSTKVIRKWNHDVNVFVEGSPSQDDLKALDVVVGDLNKLLNNKIKVNVTKNYNTANVRIYFGAVNTFGKRLSTYVPGNWGFFYYYWNGRNEIEKADILIATDVTTLDDRKSLIIEELTQSLGIANDSWKYPSSVFYQGWTTTQQFSEMDKSVIRMLYSDDIKVGMNDKDVDRVLNNKK